MLHNNKQKSKKKTVNEPKSMKFKNHNQNKQTIGTHYTNDEKNKHNRIRQKSSSLKRLKKLY
jgi:hypothetical protein